MDDLKQEFNLIIHWNEVSFGLEDYFLNLTLKKLIPLFENHLKEEQIIFCSATEICLNLYFDFDESRFLRQVEEELNLHFLAFSRRMGLGSQRPEHHLTPSLLKDEVKANMLSPQHNLYNSEIFTKPNALKGNRNKQHPYFNEEFKNISENAKASFLKNYNPKIDPFSIAHELSLLDFKDITDLMHLSLAWKDLYFFIAGLEQNILKAWVLQRAIQILYEDFDSILSWKGEYLRKEMNWMRGYHELKLKCKGAMEGGSGLDMLHKLHSEAFYIQFFQTNETFFKEKILEGIKQLKQPINNDISSKLNKAFSYYSESIQVFSTWQERNFTLKEWKGQNSKLRVKIMQVLSSSMQVLKEVTEEWNVLSQQKLLNRDNAQREPNKSEADLKRVRTIDIPISPAQGEAFQSLEVNHLFGILEHYPKLKVDLLFTYDFYLLLYGLLISPLDWHTYLIRTQHNQRFWSWLEMIHIQWSGFVKTLNYEDFNLLSSSGHRNEIPLHHPVFQSVLEHTDFLILLYWMQNRSEIIRAIRKEGQLSFMELVDSWRWKDIWEIWEKKCMRVDVQNASNGKVMTYSLSDVERKEQRKQEIFEYFLRGRDQSFKADLEAIIHDLSLGDNSKDAEKKPFKNKNLSEGLRLKKDWVFQLSTARILQEINPAAIHFIGAGLYFFFPVYTQCLKILHWWNPKLKQWNNEKAVYKAYQLLWILAAKPSADQREAFYFLANLILEVELDVDQALGGETCITEWELTTFKMLIDQWLNQYPNLQSAAQKSFFMHQCAMLPGVLITVDNQQWHIQCETGVLKHLWSKGPSIPGAYRFPWSQMIWFWNSH